MGEKNIYKNLRQITWIALLVLFTAWPAWTWAAGIKMVSVAGEKINLRKGPSTSYPIMWELGKSATKATG
jgi:uncharacterized protein YraI